MKTIFIALVVLLSSLSAFAQDYKFVVLQFKDENGENTLVKVKITKKMFNERIEPGIGVACYTTLNPAYIFKLIHGHFFYVSRPNENVDIQKGTSSTARVFSSLDNIYAYNTIEVSGGYFKDQTFIMSSAKNYIETQSQPYNAHLPKLEDIAEVAPSKLSSQVHVNTFACAFMGVKGPIDPPN